MKRTRNWVIGIALAATAGFIALQDGIAPAVRDDLSTASITNTPTIIFTDTPIATPAYEGCGYMWAYHNDLALTEKINTAVQSADPDATARAELFGEDCVYADGTSTFSAMETDFYVQLPVENLTDEAALGNWMIQVMSFVTKIPNEEMQGNNGFVEFSFMKSETENIIVRVPIGAYLTEPEKSGVELFRFFHIPTVKLT